ncbi:putative transcriptional regulator, contains C-terminal CBS domains [Bernardetia litoralis DSM 6794]|uniref:Putative transcriptional regulator, contains C-terminal CBS domains n=1 Tax=Bernardetia litoralis (strain ATCC 23117 / DSM 6794 / NBRC 15988 / NCIMB 1366 / Fx l1 / Sio-4) TaxID=880071 RepID=I4AGR0_BERLS|nr:CBS domain-containing protein [Bernardetia litoralis]AFM03145.1 putative transcriptional regulator, contains C-terminal CBS domains [Bernardetia litoralis DSM 6794]
MTDTYNTTSSVMVAADLINEMIPPLKGNDSVRKALNWMDAFRITQLPIVENNIYKGIITEDMLYEINNPDAIIDVIEPLYEDVFVGEDQHFYDVMRLATDHNLRIIAVVDLNNMFVGAITVRDTLAAFARTFANQSRGAIIVMSMNYRDYSLSHISRLIEENNTKILSSYVDTDPYDTSLIKLTLKLDKTELTPILATLERFEYRVIAKFQENPDVDVQKERLDMFFRYFDI